MQKFDSIILHLAGNALHHRHRMLEYWRRNVGLQRAFTKASKLCVQKFTVTVLLLPVQLQLRSYLYSYSCTPNRTKVITNFVTPYLKIDVGRQNTVFCDKRLLYILYKLFTQLEATPGMMQCQHKQLLGHRLSLHYSVLSAVLNYEN